MISLSGRWDDDMNKIITSRSKETETEVVEIKFSVSDDQYETVLIPLQEWYLNGQVYQGKLLSTRQICQKLNIDKNLFKAMMEEIKMRNLLDVSSQGRAEFFRSTMTEVNMEIQQLTQKLEMIIYPMRKSLDDLDEDEALRFYSSEGGAMLMATITKLLSQRESLIGKKMDMAKTLFGTTSASNPIYEALDDISGAKEMMTKDEIVELLDNAKEIIAVPTELGNLDLNYDEYIKMIEVGDEVIIDE